MSEIDTGGPVYPQYAEPMGNDVYKIGPEGGITRRDQLADDLLCALVGNSDFTKTKDFVYVEAAYQLADKQIAEGRKGEG